MFNCFGGARFAPRSLRQVAWPREARRRLAQPGANPNKAGWKLEFLARRAEEAAQGESQAPRATALPRSSKAVPKIPEHRSVVVSHLSVSVRASAMVTSGCKILRGSNYSSMWNCGFAGRQRHTVGRARRCRRPTRSGWTSPRPPPSRRRAQPARVRRIAVCAGYGAQQSAGSR